MRNPDFSRVDLFLFSDIGEKKWGRNAMRKVSGHRTLFRFPRSGLGVSTVLVAAVALPLSLSPEISMRIPVPDGDLFAAKENGSPRGRGDPRERSADIAPANEGS